MLNFFGDYNVETLEVVHRFGGKNREKAGI